MFHPIPQDDSAQRWLAVKNVAGEDAPACGLVRVTGRGQTGPYTVAKPDTDDGYVWVLSGEAVPNGFTGAAVSDGPVVALYEEADGTPAPGETWGAAAGSWKLRKGKAGWRILGGAGGGLVNAVRAPAPGATATTTTTTTAGPCSGACQWTYSDSTKLWSKSSSTCGAGCACLAPTWCPSGDACATTACGHLAADQPAPNCTGTTTTAGSCTTTTPSGCAAGCAWYCHPVRGWVQRSNGCTPDCPCPTPAGPCGAAQCAQEATTACAVQPYYCTGSCRWMWISAELGWYYVGGTCSSYGVPGCACDPPAGSGSACGQEVSTACYSPGGNNPCQNNTTTTAGPGCVGSCLWGTTNGTDWNTVVRPCVGDGCLCSPPLGSPTGTCSQSPGVCVQGPTTTTAGPTTTTTTTTAGGTTTTAGPCATGTCDMLYTGGGWVLTRACPTPTCCCPAPPFGSPGMAYTANCSPGSSGCATTTTASGTTTTTTTTTTTGGGPCTGVCAYVCNGFGFWASNGNDCSVGCPPCPIPPGGPCDPGDFIEVPCNNS